MNKFIFHCSVVLVCTLPLQGAHTSTAHERHLLLHIVPCTYIQYAKYMYPVQGVWCVHTCVHVCTYPRSHPKCLSVLCTHKSTGIITYKQYVTVQLQYSYTTVTLQLQYSYTTVTLQLHYSYSTVTVQLQCSYSDCDCSIIKQ